MPLQLSIVISRTLLRSFIGIECSAQHSFRCRKKAVKRDMVTGPFGSRMTAGLLFSRAYGGKNPQAGLGKATAKAKHLEQNSSVEEGVGNFLHGPEGCRA